MSTFLDVARAASLSAGLNGGLGMPKLAASMEHYVNMAYEVFYLSLTESVETLIIPSLTSGHIMLNRKLIGTALCAAVSMAACAKSPDSIGPAYVSDVGYRSWSCGNLNEEYERLRSALGVASRQQEDARNTDAVGILLVGLPVSSPSGDNVAPEIARLKGEIEAVRKAAISTNCQRTA